MTEQPRAAAVHCPKCRWRILDKISPTSGEIQIKCPRCRQEVQLNLSKEERMPFTGVALGIKLYTRA